MKLSINLASRPFIELRPLFARLRLVAAGLLVLAILLSFGLHSLNARAAAAEAQMNALRAKTQQYQQERQRNEARMRQPQNMAVLERSQFLNSLFARKGFSWTSVMMDLERVLPAGVQVTSIEPTTAKNGDVSIRLRVSGDRERAVELVRNLERSQRFISPRLSGEQMQAHDNLRGNAQMASAAQGGVEFDILSGYNPLTPEAKSAQQEPKKAGQTEASAPKDAVSKTPLTVSRRARGTKAVPPQQRPLMSAPGGVR